MIYALPFRWCALKSLSSEINHLDTWYLHVLHFFVIIHFSVVVLKHNGTTYLNLTHLFSNQSFYHNLNFIRRIILKTIILFYF